jgi:hypothetical protein
MLPRRSIEWEISGRPDKLVHGRDACAAGHHADLATKTFCVTHRALRSAAPTSNNIDRGRIELVIKCYPDGLLSGKYLAGLTDNSSDGDVLTDG